jgi:beta-xylosidase
VKNTADIAVPQTTDEFETPRLGLQWQWHSNYENCWYSLTEHPGYLRLYPQFVLKGDFSKAGNLLLQKFPARSFAVETQLEISPDSPDLFAGIMVMGLEYAALDAQRTNEGYWLRLRMTSETRGEYFVAGAESVRLRIEVREGGVCAFGIADDKEGFYQIGPVFHARPGRWIGAKVGIYCLTPEVFGARGHADFDYFRVAAVQEAGDKPSLAASNFILPARVLAPL